MDQRVWGKSNFASLLCQLKRPVSRMKEMVPCNISLLESTGKSLHPYNKICDRSSFERLAIPRGLINGRMEEFYPEGFFSGYRKRGRAAKSVPHSQYHHLLDTLHLLHL